LILRATAGSVVSIGVHEAIKPDLALAKQLDKGIADTLVYVTVIEDQDFMFARRNERSHAPGSISPV